jgi:hypothetical protein
MWSGYIASMGEKKCMVEKAEKMVPLENLSIDGRIILRVM